jgi:hypothetical protein
MTEKSDAWLIQGYDGKEQTFTARLSIAMSTTEITQLLRCLASQHLTSEEIVASSLRKRSKAYRALLEVREGDGKRTTLTAGKNPYYTASVYPEAELEAMDVSFSALR